MWSVTSLLAADPTVETEDAKTLLREAIRHHRDSRGSRERQQAGVAIAQRAAEIVSDAGCVASYASRPSEPGTGPLMDHLHNHNIQVLLPMLGPGLSRDWALHNPGEPLEVRAPGRPPDPAGPGLGVTALQRADVIFAPALAVDRTGVRLGQGGGWYDRVLEHRRPDAPVIAVIFDDEVADGDLPRAPHDRQVDGILSPSGWWFVGEQEPESA
ncbi:MAG: 5-formyltetrahydrofolate cyclo-ligase [Beutenbergiaceae bacterium]